MDINHMTYLIYLDITDVSCLLQLPSFFVLFCFVLFWFFFSFFPKRIKTVFCAKTYSRHSRLCGNGLFRGVTGSRQLY